MSLNELEALKLEKLRREKQRRMSVQQPDIEQPQQQEESFGQMILGNLKEAGQKTYREGISPVLSAVDLATFGIPKAITGQVGGKELTESIFPEQETMQGKITRAATSVPALFSGGAASLARGTANVLTPQLLGRLGLSLKAGEVAARSKAVLANKITRGAIEGSVFGLTQLTPDEEGGISLGGQLGQSALGGVAGAALPIISTKAGDIARGYRRFRTPTKTPSAVELTERIKEKRILQKEAIELTKKSELRNIDDSIYSTNQQKKRVIFDNKIEFGKEIKNTANQLKKNVLVLDNVLQSKSEEVSTEIQKKLPSFYKANSKAFETKLDDIADGLTKRGENLTYGEINAMLDKVVMDMDDALIIEGTPREAIMVLKNKYNIDFVDNPSNFFKESTGLPASTITSNMDEIVPLKTFFNDIKNIRNTLSAGARSGTTRFTQEDVAVSIFNKSTGELLETRVPELKGLREAYAPIIQSMKVSNRIFKPFKGDFDTKAGTQLLKRFALNKTEQGEELLIRAIENGSDFAPGFGPITSSLKKQGMELIEAKQRIQPILQDMQLVNNLQRSDIEKNFAQKVMELKSKKEFIVANSLEKEKMIEKIISDRLRQIGVRDNMINNLSKDKRKLRTAFVNLLWTTGGIGSVIAAGYGLKRTISR